MKFLDRKWGYSNQRLYIIRSPAIVARFGSSSLRLSYLIMPDGTKVAVSIILGDLSFLRREVVERMFQGVDSDIVFAFGNYDKHIADHEIKVDYRKGAHPFRETFMIIENLINGMVSIAEDSEDRPPFGVITTQSILWLYSYFMGRSVGKKQTAIVV